MTKNCNNGGVERNRRETKQTTKTQEKQSEDVIHFQQIVDARRAARENNHTHPEPGTPARAFCLPPSSGRKQTHTHTERAKHLREQIITQYTGVEEVGQT